MRLGPEQLRTLMMMASPSSILVTPPDRCVRSLEKRGLVAPFKGDKGRRITPTGMRVLADAFETGKLDQFMKH